MMGVKGDQGRIGEGRAYVIGDSMRLILDLVGYLFVGVPSDNHEIDDDSDDEVYLHKGSRGKDINRKTGIL